ncbi:MAG: ABC transporter permease [Coriobacteriia bacterium]
MMRRVIALAWLNLLQLSRNPSEVVALIALPIALTMVFGASFAGSTRERIWLPVVDEDSSTYSAQVVRLLERERSFDVEVVSRERATAAVADQQTGLAVFIPRGFGEAVESGDAEIRTLSFPASNDAAAVSAVVQGIAVRMSTGAAVAGVVSRGIPARAFEEAYLSADALWEPQPPIAVEGQTVIASDVRGDGVQASGNTQSSAGFTVFFLMFVTFGGAGAILEEREQGTLRRLLVTPTDKAALITGKVAGIVMTAIAQVLVLTVVGRVAFGVPWGNHFLAEATILFCYILAITGLAVLVSAVVRSRDQFSGAGPIISTGLAMLGGSYWSLDIVSPSMQAVARATPTGWAMIGLTDVLARNQGLEAVALPSLMLLGFAAVTLGLGVKLLRFE